MPTNPPPKATSSTLLALFALALLVHLAGTWILPLIDRDETYYAEVSREMTQRGDLVVPWFNGKIWLEKPPLLYWCQSVCYRVFGDNDFAARFPGAIASSLTALVIFGFCSRLYGQAVAWRAAVGFTVCLEMLIFGKAGITDMPAVFFTTLAAWAGWELLVSNRDEAHAPADPDSPEGTAAVLRKPSPRWWWIFYLSLAGAFLAKGPLAVLPVAGVCVYWCWSRVPGFFRTMKFIRGLSLTAAIAALWFVPALIQTKGALYSIFIQQQVIDRSLQVSQGHGASSALGYVAILPFYFVLALATFFPWSIWFPEAFRRFRKERSPAEVYLISSILVTFLLFSVVRTKLLHYTLPAYPLMACAIAPMVPRTRFIRWSAIMVVLNFALAFGLFPFATRYSVPLQFQTSGLLRSDMAFAAVEYQEPSLIWYLRKRVHAFMKQIKKRDVAAYMHQDGPRFCVLPTHLLGEIPLDPAWKVLNAHGFDMAKGKKLELSLLVKPEK